MPGISRHYMEGSSKNRGLSSNIKKSFPLVSYQKERTLKFITYKT